VSQSISAFHRAEPERNASDYIIRRRCCNTPSDSPQIAQIFADSKNPSSWICV